ncbi:MAG: hypothetical protein Q4B26_07385 [Eubacteriales bacterium]|nr:hypothetical protein [Eubacteriales bacterium]
MIIKYEMACKEAGLSEEKTAEIRRMFDADNKRVKRMRERKEREGISWVSVTDMSREEAEDFELEDMNVDVEGSVIHSLTLHELRGYLMELPEEDREFLYDCFADCPDANKRVAEKYGMTIGKVRYKKLKLIELLRERFHTEL